MPSPMIWVISDDPTIRKTLTIILERTRCQVTSFQVSQDALTCLKMYPTQAPHLVCLHPSSDEDGYKVSEQLRARTMTMRIILFSPSPTHPVELIKAQRAGVDRLLAIPTPNTIHAVIPIITTLLQLKDK